MAKDIKLKDGLLHIRDGDFVAGDSYEQEIEDLILFTQGSWKEFPLLGVGITNYQNSSGKGEELQVLIKKNLELDGKNSSGLKTSLDANGKYLITLDAIKG